MPPRSLSSSSDSPNLRGKRVVMDAADHPYAGREGIVVDQVACSHTDGACGYDWLYVELDDGVIARVYEPEASVVL